MVPNGAAYDNYPSFANNGTKTPPGGSTESAKYALGMVPADTFPAEWANYLFHGATAGITRLNSDTGSIKKEINTVLSNFNITPDATLNNQLMAALTKLKAEAALAAHPVGSLYWTSSTENPATTFGGGTWVQIKDKFILAAGDTYTNGATGGEATVTLTENQMPKHTHTFNGSPVNTNSKGDHSHTTNSQSSSTTGANDKDHTHTMSHGHSINDPGHSHSIDYGSGGSSSKPRAGNNWASSTYSSGSSTTGITVNNYTGSTLGESQSHKHSYSHTHGTDTQGAHTHSVTASGTNTKTGGDAAHNNMPPYVVKYCWERTA